MRRATRSARREAAAGRSAQDRRQHDPHLHLREGRAQAAAHAAAVRDPGVGRGRALEEALGAERVRVRVGVRAGVGEPDRGRDVGARRQPQARCTPGRPPAGGPRAARPAAAAATRRPRRARTARRRRACASISSGWRVSRSSVQASPVAVVSCPASSSVISWSRTSRSLIAEPSSKRTCTSSEQMSSPGARAPRGDLGHQPRVDLRRHLGQALQRLAAPEQHRNLQLRRDRRRQQVAQQVVQRVALGHAEDRAQDHLERDLLHRRMHRERLAHGPARRARARRRRRRPSRRPACGRRGTAAASPCGATGGRRPPAAAASAGRPAAAAWSCAPAAARATRSAYSARIASGEESITSGVLKPVKVTLNASP